jgi:hypothetical protein
MGSLIVSTQMTLDGVIDVGEWYVADGEHDRAGKDQLAHAHAVLLGRKTYEGLAAYWSPLLDDWANLINPKGVRCITHARRPARVECDAPRRRHDCRCVETQGRACFRPVDLRLRRVGSVAPRCNTRRRAPILGTSCAVGLGRTPLAGRGNESPATPRVRGFRFGRHAPSVRADLLNCRRYPRRLA